MGADVRLGKRHLLWTVRWGKKRRNRPRGILNDMVVQQTSRLPPTSRLHIYEKCGEQGTRTGKDSMSYQGLAIEEEKMSESILIMPIG